MFLTLKSFIKEFQSTAHCEYRKASTAGYIITANCFKVSITVWMGTNTNIFSRYRVLQLFCRNVEGAHDIMFSQK